MVESLTFDLTLLKGLPSLIEVSRGSKGFELKLIDKFAENASVGTTEEDIWTTGGLYTYQTSAQTLEIVSADAADDSGGTGARTVEIFGLDGSFDEISETLIMDGTTEVDTVNDYIRIYRILVRTAGSGGKNAGLITLQVSGGGDIQADIEIGDNQSLMSQYTIPNAFYGFPLKFFGNVGKGQDVIMRFYARPENEVFQVKKSLRLFENSVIFPEEPEIRFAPKTDLVVRAVTSAGTVPASAGYGLLLMASALVTA